MFMYLCHSPPMSLISFIITSIFFSFFFISITSSILIIHHCLTLCHMEPITFCFFHLIVPLFDPIKQLYIVAFPVMGVFSYNVMNCTIAKHLYKMLQVSGVVAILSELLYTILELLVMQKFGVSQYSQPIQSQVVGPILMSTIFKSTMTMQFNCSTTIYVQPQNNKFYKL